MARPSQDVRPLVGPHRDHPGQGRRGRRRLQATVSRNFKAYRAGGLDGLREWDVMGPVSELAGHARAIKASLEQSPVRTVAEAADRIKRLTGLERGLTQTRVFLKDLGFQWQRTRALPEPPKVPRRARHHAAGFPERRAPTRP